MKDDEPAGGILHINIIVIPSYDRTLKTLLNKPKNDSTGKSAFAERANARAI